LDASAKQTGVQFTQRLVQVVIGIMAFRLGIGEGIRQVPRKQWHGDVSARGARRPQEVGHRFLDDNAFHFIECSPNPRMRKGPRENTPPNAKIVARANNA
jgi:hypothetical protein